MEKIIEILENQIKLYPKSEIQDILKAVYQSVFGCAHFIEDEERCRILLHAELSECDGSSGGIEDLGEYCRIPLNALDSLGINSETLLRIFILSAKKEERKDEYIAFLDLLPRLCEEGILPFKRDEMLKSILSHKEHGCPSLHHTGVFRERYDPHYRVVRKEYAELIPLLSEIEDLMRRKERVVIAIDGYCASGKSTLGECLCEIYSADLIHMDDYFLPSERKTPERLAEPGGNVDYERFLEEVLSPLSQNKEYISRPYRCHGGYYEDGISLVPSRLTVIEGSYSLHPRLESRYDLKVFMYTDKHDQLKRLKSRNPNSLERFIGEWIPFEMNYFEKTDILHRCDIMIRSTKDFEYKVKKNEK